MRGTATYTHTHKKRVKIEKPLWDLSWGFFPLPARCEQSQGLQHPENAPQNPAKSTRSRGRAAEVRGPRCPSHPNLPYLLLHNGPLSPSPLAGCPAFYCH